MTRSLSSDQIMFTQDWDKLCNDCRLDANASIQKYLSEDKNRVISLKTKRIGSPNMMVRVKVNIEELVLKLL